MSDQSIWKRILPYVAIVVGFVAISMAYFTPQLSGKRLDTHDSMQWRGSSEEARQHYEETGEYAFWTNSQFGGMPTYYVYLHYPNNFFRPVVNALIFTIDRPASYVILAMICFFLLGNALGANKYLSAVMAVLYAFNSYLFVITEAGHFAKTTSLAFLPALLAGIIFTYKRKYYLGFALTALVFCFELIAKHPQMTYYFVVFLMVPYGIYELVKAVKSKQIKQFLISSAVAAGALIVGLLPNFSQLWVTQEYSKYSTRGKSELTIKGEDQTTGLDKSYILSWSNGIAETFSLMVPDIKGGASGRLSESDAAMDAVSPKFRQVMGSVDKYWGNQPFVGGPMYSGALVVFLFVLGLFLVKSPVKWPFLFAAIITTALSWGNNLMWLSDWFIEHFPLYNKFRAVASIQTVTHYCLPVIALLAVKELQQNQESLNQPLRLFGKELKLERKNALWLAFAFTGGLSLLFALMPDVFFSFFKDGEMQRLMNQLQGAGWAGRDIDGLLDNIQAAREAILTQDAWRSFFFILIGGVAAFLFVRKTLSFYSFLAVIGVAGLIDLWMVNKNYLNDEDFTVEREVMEPFQKAPANNFIEQNEGLNDRVLNLSVSTFNETGTSYFHKSIGGYSGVKLKRYQEMVEFHISDEIAKLRQGIQNVSTQQDLNQLLAQLDVLNALNTRFIILDPNRQPIVNTQAYGNAWFVQKIKTVSSADDEMLAINDVQLNQTAVVRDEFAEAIPANLATGSIQLTNYELDYLTYESKSSSSGLAVFSEVYYPKGWNVTIDGEPAEFIRVNYFMRGLVIPEGKHTIEWKFEPQSYKQGEQIAMVGSILLLISFVGGIGMHFKSQQ